MKKLKFMFLVIPLFFVFIGFNVKAQIDNDIHDYDGADVNYSLNMFIDDLVINYNTWYYFNDNYFAILDEGFESKVIVHDLGSLYLYDVIMPGNFVDFNLVNINDYLIYFEYVFIEDLLKVLNKDIVIYVGGINYPPLEAISFFEKQVHLDPQDLYNLYLYKVNQYNDLLIDIYDEAFNDGYILGYLDGKDDGYIDGYNDGYSFGYDKGYDIGINEGDIDGYNDGYNKGYDFGYDEGYDEGYDLGFSDARDDYGIFYNNEWWKALNWGNKRFNEGVLEGETSDLSLRIYNFLPGILGAIFMFFYTIFSIEFLGVSLMQILGILLTIGGAYLIIRFFLK